MKTATVTVNPKIYSLDVIYSASYVFLDRAYIKLEGDPDKEVEVIIKTNEEKDLEKIKKDFENELLNYAFYKSQVEKTKEIRNIILQRALLTNESEEGLNLDENDFSGDPEEVVPWENE